LQYGSDILRSEPGGPPLRSVDRTWARCYDLDRSSDRGEGKPGPPAVGRMARNAD